MNEGVKNRIEWVDCAKGLAIILVVYGHALTYFSPNFDNFVHVVYSFHMPLFFALTGYVSAYSYDGSDFCLFFKKKINALMKPYFLYAIILLFFKILKSYLSGSTANGGYVNCLANTMLITRKSYISELWFLPCLLIAHCLMFVIVKKKTAYSWAIVILCFGFTLLGRLTCNVALPCNIDNALLSLPFILGGIKWRIATKDKKRNYNILDIFIVTVCVFVCINYVEIARGYSIDYFADIVIGNVILFFFSAVAGTIIIAMCAQFVSHHEKVFLKMCLMKCGQNSLSIYCLHYVVLAVVYQILKRFRSDSLGGQLILIIAETGIVIALILLLKESLMRWNKYKGRN